MHTRGVTAPGAEEDEVWFDADELERISTIEIDPSGRGLLRIPFDPALLDADARTHVLGLARLPGPPGLESQGGYGLGEAAERLLGGLVTGRCVWLRSADLPAARATRHLLAQLGEGLALASADGAGDVVTPVLVMASGSRRDFQLWSLSRWTGFPQRIFGLGPDGARRIGGHDERAVEGAFRAARHALSERLGRARHHLRLVDGDAGLTGPALLAHVADAFNGWREELREATGRSVAPVLLIEDLERWRSLDDPGGLEATWSAVLDKCHAHGWAAVVHAAGAPPVGARPTHAAVVVERSAGGEVRMRDAAAPEGPGVPLRHDPDSGRVGEGVVPAAPDVTAT